MSSNEALMKTLRLHALLADGTDIAQRAMDERRFALERFTWPLRNVTRVGLAPPVVYDRLRGRGGDRPVVAFSDVAPAA
jgi:hypothetical protein